VRNTSAAANSGHEPTQIRTMQYQYVFMCDNIYISQSFLAILSVGKRKFMLPIALLITSLLWTLSALPPEHQMASCPLN